MVNKPLNRRQLLGGLGVGVASLAGCPLYRDDSRDTPDSTGTDRKNDDMAKYDNIVIFRNDDPAPWTDIEVISAVNDIFVNNRVPLTQGVVPADEDNNEDLTSDHDICNYLKSRTEDNPELFENALHGYTHARETNLFWGSEFGGLSYEQQNQKVTDAVRIFESCFEREPTSFIPPFNTYDETTVRVLVENGFKLVSGNYYFQQEYFGKEGMWVDDEIIHLPVNLAMEDSDTQEVRAIDDLKQEYDKNKKEQSLNVIMFHYHRYTAEEDRQTLDELIRYALDDGSKFMTLEKFAEGINDGAITRTENGWKVNEFRSSTAVSQ